ncbi:MAG: hypothetical protein ACRD07_10915 [Acidimicrobiales bacterium]
MYSAADHTRAQEAAAAGPPEASRRGWAEYLLDIVVGHDRMSSPGAVAAYYERILEAARTPSVRAGIQRWNRVIADTVGSALVQHGIDVPPRVVLALVDGSVVSWLLDEDQLDVQTAADRLADGLDRLGACPGARGAGRGRHRRH